MNPKTAGPKPPYPKQRQHAPVLEARMTPRPRYDASAYLSAGKLRGKRALVTGGDSGIGRAVAVLYAREGADVAIVYLPEEEEDAQETRRAIQREGRKAVLIPGDLTHPEFCRQAVSRAVRELGGLDILVNNAAHQASHERLEDVSDEDWDRTFKTNIYGYFRVTKAALRFMREGAVIVNCGSVTGFRGSKNLPDYASTKGAIHAFTMSLAVNLAERGIRVNCVAPGPVWTPLNASDRTPEAVSKVGEKTPLERPAQPEEIAPAFVFLASNADSSYLTGEIIGARGGAL